MNNGLSNEAFRLALTLHLVGFWSTIHPPVGMVLNEALATLRRTPCGQRRRQIVRDLWRIADEAPLHDERVQALVTLANHFRPPERPTHVRH